MMDFLGLEEAALLLLVSYTPLACERAQSPTSAAWSPDRRRPNHAHVNNNLSYYTY